jgi:hypothetical protein
MDIYKVVICTKENMKFSQGRLLESSENTAKSKSFKIPLMKTIPSLLFFFVF